MREETISFISQGLKLSAWLFLPEGMVRPPVVVMAHGFGATRVLGLRPFAERFVAAGLACLVFDYRNFGDSEGVPRNLISPRRHVDDWLAAIDLAAALPEVDGTRLGLWGTSFSGGHVLVATAERPAVISLVLSFYRPVLRAAEIGCPVLMIAAEHDSLIRLKDVEKCAAKIPRVKMVSLPVAHFEVYTGEWFAKVSSMETEFLAEQLR